MTVRIHCITLPVDDLPRAFNFYTEALALPTGTATEISKSSDNIAFELAGGLHLVLTRRGAFRDFTRLAEIVDAPAQTSECILSYFAGSADEVDQILARAVAAGAHVANAPQDQVWGYAGYFSDPDGHLWEILWNPQMPA